ncbi:LysR family transcriptional regulator [Streptomyces sp. CB02923]|uniref:LysR family transcriptional regulator n=1 Tax=Streptomyces sp. CB02923 TaxID=1718985 RepID=UPI00190126FD|nr:LysR family transcriptional regulator [Streptomyces sp. CB02923]
MDYFVTAAETGTMTGAAQRLYVSQSAVSAGIGELEHQLGVQLLIRAKAKGLTLTTAGHRFLPEARALLTRSEEIQVGMREVGQTLAGRLVIGCFTTLAPFLLPRLLEEFRTAHPKVTLDFVEGSLNELQDLLREGKCEVAMLYGFDVQSGIDFEELRTVEPYVLLPPGHPLAETAEIRLPDLDGHDMIMLDVPPSLRYFTDILRCAGVIPKIRYRTESFELVRSLVARGAGYSLLLQRPAQDVSYEGRRLQVRRIAGDVDRLSVGLARPSSSRPTRRAAAFAAFCHAQMEHHPAAEQGARRYGPMNPGFPAAVSS